jgi:addiction module HigA family antidote
MPMFNPPHPGRSLKEAIKSMHVTIADFAVHLGVSRSYLSRVVNCRTGITADLSMRLGEAFGHSSDLWFKMQNAHDLWQATHAKRKRVRPFRLAA